MARVDLKRRGEIGRERRSKTRAQLIEAARCLFTTRPFSSVTVEEVTRQAGLSKGAFYSHFRGLDDLWAAVAAELAAEFEGVRRREPALRRRPRRENRRRLRGLHKRGSARSRVGSAHRPRRLGFCECRLRGPRALEDEPATCAKRGTARLFFGRGRLRSRLRRRHPSNALGERSEAVAP